MSTSLFLVYSDYIVTAYLWQRGCCAAEHRFDNTPEGQELFRVYWRKAVVTGPVYLLVDVIEEDLHNETTPKMMGSNRKKMLDGRAKRVFRHTPFYFSHVQGKVADDKQKEHVLFMGLSEPDNLLNWLEILQDHRAQLAGIVSLPFLCQELFKKCVPGAKDALFVIPNVGGLRQIFFRDGRMQVSRLSAFHVRGAEHVQMFLHGEVARMQGYLASLRLVKHDALLDVYVLCHGALYALLASGENRVSSYNGHPLDAEALARRFRIPVDPQEVDHMERFFCGYLLKQSQRDHYARRADTRLHRTLRLRTQLRIANVSLLLLGLIVGGAAFLDGFMIYAQLPQISRQADEVQVALQALLSQDTVSLSSKDSAPLPSPSEGGGDPLVAVQTLDAVREYATEPNRLLVIVSQVLTHHPDIWVNGMEWSTGLPKKEGAEAKEQPTRNRARGPKAPPPRSNVQPGIQHAQLRGEVRPFAGDMGLARVKILAFVDALRSLPTVSGVDLLSMPVDPTQTAILDRSNMEAAAKRAEFVLLVTLHADKKDG